MAFILLKRITILKAVTKVHSWPRRGNLFSLRAWAFLGHEKWYSVTSGIHLSPLFLDNNKACLKDCKIELVDDEAWQVSSCLKDAWKGNENDEALKMRPPIVNDPNDDNWMVNSVTSNNDDPYFDEIEDMRIRGNLFYKIDRDSKEYEEYKFDFHRRKHSTNGNVRKEGKENKKKENSSHKSVSGVNKTSKKDKPTSTKENREIKTEVLLGHAKKGHLSYPFHEVGDWCVGKKQRVPTFNQLTAPYHEPFCLDIYISKGSVRASIIHRATSNVVAVSHSISKDMKFDLSSTKNRRACAAVGEVLAQRALADDIHNVVYTPRKGEKLEGKLQIVLKSIIDGGIDVKVKLKQSKSRKARNLPTRTRDKLRAVKGNSYLMRDVLIAEVAAPQN